MLKIKAARLARGWNQQTVAQRAKMQAAELSRIETGRLIPYPRQAKNLARVLGLRPDELLDQAEAQAHAS
jgi:ribosome-binding protein aMBF1 (putative translation factor)